MFRATNSCTTCILLQKYTYPLTAVDMADSREKELDDLVAEYRETSTLEELLEAGKDGTLGLNHECQWIEEWVEEEFFPVGL